MKQEIAKIALKKLFSQPFFSICEIDHLIQMLNVQPDGEIYYAMKALHCVHYRDMGAEVREWLFANAVRMCAGQPTFALARVDAAFDRMLPSGSPEFEVRDAMVRGHTLLMAEAVQ